MPPRRYKKRTYRKKRYPKKKNPGKLSVGRFLGVPTQTALVKMRYNQAVSINPAIASAESWVFSVNNIYDPDNSGVGHQPIMRDFWYQLYDAGVVLYSNIKVTIENRSTSAAIRGFVRLSPNSTKEPTPEHNIESGLTRHKTIPCVGSGRNLGTIKHSFNAKKMYGSVDRSELRCGQSSGPSDSAFFIVGLEPLDHTTDLPACYANVIIDYYVLMSSPRLVAQS